MKWMKASARDAKDLFWKTSNGKFIIRRGPDNDMELVMHGKPVFRGTQDECKQEAKRYEQ